MAAALCACGGDETKPGGTGGGDPGLEPICNAGTRWSPGTKAFEERAAAWGLATVEGTRISTVDYDGDGWSDLLVRRGGDLPDGFFAPEPCCADQSCAEGVSCPVRRTWLLRNKGDKTFEDTTLASNLLVNRSEPNPEIGRPGSIYAFGDIDNDGDLDAYVGKTDNPNDPPSVETSEILLNNGDGTFALGPASSGVRVASGDAPAAAVFVDADRNGVLDLWVPQSLNLQPKQDKLYGGDGLGGFADVTLALGLGTSGWIVLGDLNEGRAHTVAWSGLACDLNGDGNAELLSASYGRAPNHLWQHVGDALAPLYENRSVVSGYAFDARVDWSDNESARCHCQLHPADPDCAGVPPPMYIACNTDADAFRWNHATDRNPYRLGGNSGATMCGDVDNDGDMDLLTTEIVHWDVGSSSDPSELLLNSGEPDVRFDRPGNEATGLVRVHDRVDWNDGDISGSLFDFDNDGWLDVYIGSTDYPGAVGLLFHNRGDGTFEAVPLADGIDHHRSHGSAVADYDHDGDLDIVVGHSRARCEADCYPTGEVRLFENVMPTGNWLAVSLEGGPGSNRSAIGARVTVVAEDGTIQTKEVGGGHGHYGAQDDLTLHFGLGSACRAEVTVRWPDAALTSETASLVSGYRFRWVQGSAPEPM